MQAYHRLMAAEFADIASGDACGEIMQAFHEVVRFDWGAVMTIDPETFLPSGGVVEGFSRADCVPFWDNELLDPDFNKFVDLARSFDPLATLADSTDGDLRRSPRYAKMYAPLEAADELRIAFVSGAMCLAVGVFVRAGQDGHITAQEIDEARCLAPVAAAALRRTLGQVLTQTAAQPPVVIILDGEGHVTGMSAEGEDVFDDLRLDGVDGDVPGIIQAAATKARSSRTSNNLTTRLRGRSGRWLRLHASPMQGPGGAVALTIEAAQPHDLARILLDSYALTPRETEIVLRLCRGLTVKEIGNELIISAHTVRDHVKAIYTKAQVRSRGELVAKLFSNHVIDRFHSSVAHVARAS